MLNDDTLFEISRIRLPCVYMYEMFAIIRKPNARTCNDAHEPQAQRLRGLEAKLEGGTVSPSLDSFLFRQAWAAELLGLVT